MTRLHRSADAFTNSAAILACMMAITAPSRAADFVTPVRVIHPGTTITAAMLVMRSADQIGADTTTELHSAVGWIAKSTLLPGQPITSQSLRRAHAVRVGQSIALVYQLDGLTVSGEGVAIEPGAPGDNIRVRNQASGIVVRGRIRDHATIDVAGP